MDIDVYDGSAPEGASMPLCSFSVTAYPDVTTVNGHIALSPFEFLARIVGKGSYVPLKPHVAALDEALHLANFAREVIDGFRIVNCRRVSPYESDPYFVGDTRYVESGARYRILVQKE